MAVLRIFVWGVAGVSLFAQGGYNDDRVMLQGFMWESHQSGRQQPDNGYPYVVDWAGKWYQHVASKAGEIADAEFNLVWLPPPSEGEGAGYHPQQLNNFNNNYGTEEDQKRLLQTFLSNGLEPIADVVINHRNGSTGWASFKNPDWPATFICSTDEFWFKRPDEVAPDDWPILEAGQKGNPDFPGEWSDWHGARDLDHENPDLRAEVKRYLEKLKALGYRGWRYDVSKGYHPRFVAEYNFATSPTFSVGEYMDNRLDRLTGWIDGTRQVGQPDPALKASSAFDFATFDLLKEFIKSSQFAKLRAISFKDQVYDGLIAVNRDKAVTFAENHDTGFPQKAFDSFENGPRLLQAYAFILTHPGVPCVYWKHYFEWNHADAIRALIKARKYAGIHSGSFIKTEVHGNDYVAIVGDQPSDSSTLIVKIGHGLQFQPDPAVWGLETSGEGYAVWLRRSTKAENQPRIDQPHLPF